MKQSIFALLAFVLSVLLGGSSALAQSPEAPKCTTTKISTGATCGQHAAAIAAELGVPDKGLTYIVDPSEPSWNQAAPVCTHDGTAWSGSLWAGIKYKRQHAAPINHRISVLENSLAPPQADGFGQLCTQLLVEGIV